MQITGPSGHRTACHYRDGVPVAEAGLGGSS
jgi:hypothetical protein